MTEFFLNDFFVVFRGVSFRYEFNVDRR